MVCNQHYDIGTNRFSLGLHTQKKQHVQGVVNNFEVKFLYSEKATKIAKSSPYF